MPGQKSKSMSSENETKGGKDMKAEGRDEQEAAHTMPPKAVTARAAT